MPLASWPPHCGLGWPQLYTLQSPQSVFSCPVLWLSSSSFQLSLERGGTKDECPSHPVKAHGLQRRTESRNSFSIVECQCGPLRQASWPPRSLLSPPWDLDGSVGGLRKRHAPEAGNRNYCCPARCLLILAAEWAVPAALPHELEARTFILRTDHLDTAAFHLWFHKALIAASSISCSGSQVSVSRWLSFLEANWNTLS